MIITIFIRYINGGTLLTINIVGFFSVLRCYSTLELIKPTSQNYYILYNYIPEAKWLPCNIKTLTCSQWYDTFSQASQLPGDVKSQFRSILHCVYRHTYNGEDKVFQTACLIGCAISLLPNPIHPVITHGKLHRRSLILT